MIMVNLFFLFEYSSLREHYLKKWKKKDNYSLWKKSCSQTKKEGGKSTYCSNYYIDFEHVHAKLSSLL